jgi:hypothetical protein
MQGDAKFKLHLEDGNLIARALYQVAFLVDTCSKQRPDNNSEHTLESSTRVGKAMWMMDEGDDGVCGWLFPGSHGWSHNYDY